MSTPGRPDVQRLVCSVGIGRLQETTYRYGGAGYPTRFAPVALAHLLGLGGKSASVLVTEEASDHENYAAMAGELRQAGLTVHPVLVPTGRDESEVLRGFDRVMDVIAARETVVLDVTFALRHLPFVYLAALTYLTAWQGVTIAGLYYGAWELRNKETDESPILDVTSLFRLTRWYHSLRTAEDSGDLRPLASLLAHEAEHERLMQGAPNLLLSEVKSCAAPLAKELATGLPIEIGQHARRLHDALEPAAGDVGGAAARRLALERLAHWVAPLAGTSGSRDKRLYTLDAAELERQLRLADWYAARDDVTKVLMLLREWLVSLLVLRTGGAARWLEREQRAPAERRLATLRRRVEAKLATPVERRLSELWDKIANARNAYAHAGMRPEQVGAPKLAGLLDDCRALLDDAALTALPEPTGGTLLVSPLGLAPGLLYSAVRRLAAHLLVLTSRDAHAQLATALLAACSRLQPTVLEMADPYTGFAELDGLLDADVQRLLGESREVVVNLTGGTTVMQYVAEGIGATAESLGVPVRRVALVDRRPPAAQRAAPYMLGELVPLGQPPRDRPDVLAAD